MVQVRGGIHFRDHTLTSRNRSLPRQSAASCMATAVYKIKKSRLRDFCEKRVPNEVIGKGMEAGYVIKAETYIWCGKHSRACHNRKIGLPRVRRALILQMIQLVTGHRRHSNRVPLFRIKTLRPLA
jgi:hypothetical protein